jgi:hypothetical protein
VDYRSRLAGVKTRKRMEPVGGSRERREGRKGNGELRKTRE